MPRDLTLEEARDEKIDELTEKHFNAALAALVSGHQPTVSSVDESLSHVFCDAEVMGRLIVLAVTDRNQAGAVLEQLIHDVMRTDAEVAAIKEVEQLERNAQNDPENCIPRTRATASALDRLLAGAQP